MHLAELDRTNLRGMLPPDQVKLFWPQDAECPLTLYDHNKVEPFKATKTGQPWYHMYPLQTNINEIGQQVQRQRTNYESDTEDRGGSEWEQENERSNEN